MDAPSAHLKKECLHCGYDLRGSTDSGSCPECGGAYVPGSYTWTPPTGGWPTFFTIGFFILFGASFAVPLLAAVVTGKASAMSVLMGAAVAVIMIAAIYGLRRTPREHVTIEPGGIRFRLFIDRTITPEQFVPWSQVEKVIPYRYDRQARIVLRVAVMTESPRRWVIGLDNEPSILCPFFESSEEVMAFVALVQSHIDAQRKREAGTN